MLNLNSYKMLNNNLNKNCPYNWHIKIKILKFSANGYKGYKDNKF